MAIKIHFQFDVPVFSGAARWLIAGAIVLGVPFELGSETVTLTTYYPAPSGVYTRMITTDNTFLARDGGRLGVGTTGPGLSKVFVNGNAAIGAAYATLAAPANGLIVQGSVGVGTTAPGSGVSVNGNAAIGAAYAALAAPANGLIVQGSVGIGNTAPGANALQVTGASRLEGNLVMNGLTAAAGRRGYVYITNAQTGCGVITIAPNSSGFCGGYVTFTPGLYVEGWTYQTMTAWEGPSSPFNAFPEVTGHCCSK